jgi:ABC-type phosphate transport system substrate-binding protein
MFSKRSTQRCNTVAAVWLVASLLTSAIAAAPEEAPEAPPRIAVVTHVENTTPSLSRTELARMFRKTQTEWPDGERCIPIDQMGGSEIRAEFGRIVLEESPDEWKRYWIQQTMTGNARPPIALENSDTVKKYIQKLRGAVGYIYLSEADDTVRVLAVTDAPELALPDPPEEKPEEKPANNDEGRKPDSPESADAPE